MDYGHLLRKTLIALLLCAALVTVCYFFVDRPVAFFVHDHRPGYDFVLKDLTYPPPVLEAWAPVALAALMARRAWGPFHRWEWALLAACVALTLAEEFRETVSFAAGRYWPATWVDNNPSLLRDGAYGFHPFHHGSAYGSFPSGHTARTLAVAAVAWIAYPRGRWACVLASVAVPAGLIGMDYHFVSDVIAGGFLGALVGTYTAHRCGLQVGGEPGVDLRVVEPGAGMAVNLGGGGLEDQDLAAVLQCGHVSGQCLPVVADDDDPAGHPDPGRRASPVRRRPARRPPARAATPAPAPGLPVPHPRAAAQRPPGSPPTRPSPNEPART